MTRTLLHAELARRGGFSAPLGWQAELLCKVTLRLGERSPYVAYRLRLCALRCADGRYGGGWEGER
jgi:hypothetical protein